MQSRRVPSSFSRGTSKKQELCDGQGEKSLGRFLYCVAARPEERDARESGPPLRSE